MKSKITEDSKRRELLFRHSLAQNETVLGSHPVGDSVAPSEPASKHGPVASAAEPFQRASQQPKHETDHLDEELDLLLKLDAPIDSVSDALFYNTATENNLKGESKENGKISIPYSAFI